MWVFFYTTTIVIKLQKSIRKFWSSLKITKNVSLQYDVYFNFAITNSGFGFSALWDRVFSQGVIRFISEETCSLFRHSMGNEPGGRLFCKTSLTWYITQKITI
jgi:hypothetical protein